MPFIDKTTVKYKELIKEWIVVQILEPKNWESVKFKAFLINQEVENMPDSLLMADTSLLMLAKDGHSFIDEAKVDKFLQLWYSVNKYSIEIFCIYMSIKPLRRQLTKKNGAKNLIWAEPTPKKPKVWMILLSPKLRILQIFETMVH